MLAKAVELVATKDMSVPDNVENVPEDRRFAQKRISS